MGKIKVLSEIVANKIAAGEVIERPGSIVKELIENALDAGALAVDVDIQHGGRSLIRVSDDGSGMDEADAKLAFQRHATSKISDIDDLQTIVSYGFRGEALASIAAVSRCRLITRTAKAASGTEVVVEGGAVKAVQPHPCRVGTIIEVRDLFFNTPARRKFLKSESAETGLITDIVSRMALTALKTRFTLKSGEEVLLNLSPAESLLTRAAQILSDGKTDALLKLSMEKEAMKLTAIVGKPSLTRGNRSQIHWFVNKRSIKSLPLSYAFHAGYHGRLMEGRFPVGVLCLELDPARIDVNVHPTKQEIRIFSEPEVTGFIQQAVKDLLLETGPLAPELKTATVAGAASVRNYPLSSGGTQQSSWGSVMDRASVPVRPQVPLSELEQALTAPKPVSLKNARVTRILGQLHGTFIVAETEDGFLMVDQHAAHERVMYEALLKNLKSNSPEKQNLFLDEALEIPVRQKDLFRRSLPLLEKVGFDLESFGGDSWAVRAVPAVFARFNANQIIHDFLDQAEEGKLRTTLDESPEAVAALCACKKKSVKAHDPLDFRQMQALLEQLALCENPFNCPHGRPTFFTQTLVNLEKQFKRI